MNGRTQILTALLATTTVLVLVGLGLELLLARPQLEEIRRLERRQEQLQQELSGQLARAAEIKNLAAALHLESLAELRDLGAIEEPVVFLGRLVDEAGLRRLALLSGSTRDAGPLQLNQFTVRVMGDFGRVLDLVRTLEQSPRPVLIDRFQVQTRESGGLECSFDVTVCDPIRARVG
jgi:Tfp pilus assembly protein PilO